MISSNEPWVNPVNRLFNVYVPLALTTLLIVVWVFAWVNQPVFEDRGGVKSHLEELRPCPE